ncbi:MAG TPA: formate dehydrogenase accessory sulfurtransferase FdhD [Candidatus Acidoferrales bacterium]|jgi:FdhD protein|nr:formate dehydrogenase accessory sulfurtransferase FdhD [Candidatus Acidoferrales bacterium]
MTARTPFPRSIGLTQVVEWNNGDVRRGEDYLAGEEPLEMRAGRQRIGLTLRTPGNDCELVAGFLFTEGIISRREEILSLEGEDAPRSRGAAGNVVRVKLKADVRLRAARRNFSAGSACGACGKESIAQLRRRGIHAPDRDSQFDPEMLCGLPEKLRETQAIFGRTGGLHAAALVTAGGEIVVLREDIGRHNAVDKVIGWALIQGKLPLARHALMVSGRGGFEIVQKALSAGIPLLASISAPSTLAVQLARELNLTLIGFLRGRRFIVYSGEQRIAMAAAM